MHERFRSLPFFLAALGLVLLTASPAALATTVAPPADLGHPTRMSDAVVFAQAIESRVGTSKLLRTRSSGTACWACLSGSVPLLGRRPVPGSPRARSM